MTPGAGMDTEVIVPNNGQRRTGVSGAQVPSAPPPARLPSPAAGLGYKAGSTGVWTQCQGMSTAVGMKSVVLAQVLLLLWVSTAWAEVLVQPDFDAKKVPEASMLCCGWGWELSPCWRQWRLPPHPTPAVLGAASP